MVIKGVKTGGKCGHARHPFLNANFEEMGKVRTSNFVGEKNQNI